MRIDPDKCRDSDLLAAEVRRLQAVIASGEPTLTDDERKAISGAYEFLCSRARELQHDRRLEDSRPIVQLAKTLQGLWERLGGGR